MSEFGIIAATGETGMAYLLAIIVDETRPELSAAQRAPLMSTAAVLAEIEASIKRIVPEARFTATRKFMRMPRAIPKPSD